MRAAIRLRDYGKLIKSNAPLDVVPSLSASLQDLQRIAPTLEAKATVLNYFAFYNTTIGNHREAATQFSDAFELTGDTQSIKNALIEARKSNDALTLEKISQHANSHAQSPIASREAAELYDVLCHNAGATGNLQQARKFGRKSLSLKNSLSENGLKLTERARPQFDFLNKSRNIISFSLYGTMPRYTRIAIENAKAVQYVYPGWTCRFYVDQSVPQDITQQLLAMGCQVTKISKLHNPKLNTGLFWRFLVASDPNVDFFLVRDVDSLINVREKVAVDEWIASTKDFHLMRDFYTHSELILAGLWGGVAGRIAHIDREISNFHKRNDDKRAGVHNQDQLFLRQRIWSAIKNDLLQHDSVFDGVDGVQTQNFPAVGKMEPVRHVGQDMGVFLNN